MPNAEAENPRCVDSRAIIGNALREVGHPRRVPTIVLVEDESFVRRLTAEVLTSAGYRLLVAASAVEALAACHDTMQTIDLLLADIVLPDMSGRELATRFQNCRPGARVLLMSGYPEQLACCDTPATTRMYLAKPFSVGVLLRRVREILDAELEARS